MKKVTIIFTAVVLVSILVIVLVSKPRKKVTHESVVGSWEERIGNDVLSVKLNSDNTFKTVFKDTIREGEWELYGEIIKALDTDRVLVLRHKVIVYEDQLKLISTLVPETMTLKRVSD